MFIGGNDLKLVWSFFSGNTTEKLCLVFFFTYLSVVVVVEGLIDRVPEKRRHDVAAASYPEQGKDSFVCCLAIPVHFHGGVVLLSSVLVVVLFLSPSGTALEALGVNDCSVRELPIAPREMPTAL